MTENRKFHGILTLSAASIALSQSISANSQPLDQVVVGSTDLLNSSTGPKIANLVLAPAHHEELIRLYADHASHASHSSHASHVSHYSGSDYSAPATPAPAYPSYSQPQPQPQPAPKSVPPAPKTNSVNQAIAPVDSANLTNKTSSLNATNAVNEETVETDTALVDFLKKRSAEGSADAQYSLGICYLNGQNGVKKDEGTAKLLLEMSASRGNAEAKEKLEELNQPPKNPVKTGK